MNSNTRLYRMVLIAELVIFTFVYKLYIFPNIDITLLNVTQAMYIIKSFYLFILIWFTLNYSNIMSIKLFNLFIDLLFLFLYIYDIFTFLMVFELIAFCTTFLLIALVINLNIYKTSTIIFSFIVYNFLSTVLIYKFGTISVYTLHLFFMEDLTPLHYIFIFIFLIKSGIVPLFILNSYLYRILPFLAIAFYTTLYFFYVYIILDFYVECNTYTLAICYVLLFFGYFYVYLYKINNISDFLFFSTVLFLIQLLLIAL